MSRVVVDLSVPNHLSQLVQTAIVPGGWVLGTTKFRSIGLRILYRFVLGTLELLVQHFRAAEANDVEIVVLATSSRCYATRLTGHASTTSSGRCCRLSAGSFPAGAGLFSLSGPRCSSAGTGAW